MKPAFLTARTAAKYSSSGDGGLEDSCPTDDGWGIITWTKDPQDDHGALAFGQCGGCGTWLVYFPECEQKTGFVNNTQHCDGCDAVYETDENHEGDVIGVHRVS